jgi:hypothetical protein
MSASLLHSSSSLAYHNVLHLFQGEQPPDMFRTLLILLGQVPIFMLGLIALYASGVNITCRILIGATFGGYMALVEKHGWGHVPIWVDPVGVAQLILEGTQSGDV